jgi:hypothetical protein
MILNASTFEPSCNIIQTGSYNKTCTNSYGTSFVSNFNSNLNTLNNTVGTYFNVDPTNSSTTSDASIIVTPNPLAGLFLTPTSDYGRLSVNAQEIILGNKTTAVHVPGTLVIDYPDAAGVSQSVSLGKYLKQLVRTRI